MLSRDLVPVAQECLRRLVSASRYQLGSEQTEPQPIADVDKLSLNILNNHRIESMQFL
jgi:hypothetical protein